MASVKTLCALVLPLALAAAPLTDEQRLRQVESLSRIHRTVAESHWDRELLDRVGWAALAEPFRRQVAEAADARAARAAMREMLERLGQSHFAIFEDDGVPGGTGGGGVAGFDVRLIEGEVVVTSAEPGSPVRPGWAIRMIAGEPLRIPPDLDEIWVRRAVLSRLSGPAGETVDVEFEDGSGRTVALAVRRAKPKGEMASFGYLPPQPVWVEIRELGDRIGLMAFNLFLDPVRLMPAFERALVRWRDARGLVVDLRGNPGGLGAMAMGLAGWFFERPGISLGTMLTRDGPVYFRINPRRPAFHGPVAILIDGATASTAEIFAAGLRDAGRARLFGAESAGAALPSVIEKLPNGDRFQYATAGFVRTSGAALEGAGVKPDVPAPWRRADLLAGRDAALEAALHWLREPSGSR